MAGDYAVAGNASSIPRSLLVSRVASGKSPRNRRAFTLADPARTPTFVATADRSTAFSGKEPLWEAHRL